MKGEPIEILFVEDDLAHVEIVQRSFATCRVANRLTHVADGQAALDYLRQEGDWRDPARSPRPGAVLLDLRLPKVDGLDVLKSIKTDPKLSSIPVVILTTSNAEMDIAKAYECHANSYLVKPMDFMQFTRLMDTLGYYWLAWNRRPNGTTPPGPK